MTFLKKMFATVLVFTIVSTYFCIPAFAAVSGVNRAVGTSNLGSSSGEGAKSNLVITGYKVYTGSGTTLSKLKKGSTATLEVRLKNMGVKTSQISGPGDIEVSKLVDSFTGEAVPAVTVTSKGDELLSVTIKFSGLRYEGPGKTLKFIVGYKGLDAEYDTKELIVTECDEHNGAGNNSYDGNPTPILLVSRGGDQQILKAGQETELILLIKNVSNTDIFDVVVSLTPSDSILLVEGRNTFFIKELLGKKSDSTRVKVKVAAEIASATQTISIDAKYNYDSGSAIVQGTTSDKLTISAEPTKGSDKPVPYIIVSSYDYGGSPVAANSVFKLTMDFSNTSTVTNIENIVVSMETGENFAIASSSNTFYYNALGAGKKLTQEVELQALPGAKPGAQSVEIGFKYEYSDGVKRTSNTMSEKLSVPIYLPDRFELAKPKTPEGGIAAGQETVLTIGYVNKGKVSVSNVEAIIEGDVESPAKVQNLGNIEAGKSGSIGFAFTPQQAGDLPVSLKISYEDANSKLITREFPLTITVTEAPPIVDNPEGDGTYPEGNRSPLPVILGAVAVATVAAGGMLVYKKKKAEQRTSDTDLDFAWDDQAGQDDADPGFPSGQGEQNTDAMYEETEV